MTGPSPHPGSIIRHARLDQCRGPWLVDANGRTWFDATARLGASPLGYNAAANFGVCQFAEAWTGESETDNIRGVRKAFEALLHRKLGGESRLAAECTSSANSGINPLSLGGFSPADLIRAYIEANLLDQFQGAVNSSGSHSQGELESLAAGHGDLIRRAGADGLEAWIHFHDAAGRNRVVDAAQSEWLLLESAGEHSIAMRFSLGISGDDRAWFWRQLRAAVNIACGIIYKRMNASPQIPSAVELEQTLLFHMRLVEAKLDEKQHSNAERADRVATFLAASLKGTAAEKADVIQVRLDNWPLFRDRVAAIQKQVYEPARQTSLETFDFLMTSPISHSIVLELDGQIVAMVFAAPLSCFPDERGTLDDPARDRRDVIYVADLTVDAEFRGGLGRIMKQAITLDAVLAGREALHGRNRDRLAAAMWAINLGLGSYELKHLVDDYLDDRPFRDCIYYRCPLRWEPDQAAKVAAELGRLGEQGFRQKMFELANGR